MSKFKLESSTTTRSVILGKQPPETPDPLKLDALGKPDLTMGWAPRAKECRQAKYLEVDPVASRKYDGYLVGAGGRMLEPDAPLYEATTIEPAKGRTNGLVIFVNGMLNNLSEQTRALQGVADATGAGVVGVHNATDGAVNDFVEAIGQKLNLKKPKCVETTARLVLEELDGDRPVRLMGHSQGGLVVSQALTEVKTRLEQRGLSKTAVREKLALIEVTTLGSAATTYPDGPKYTMIDNELDPVSRAAKATAAKLANVKQVWFRDEAKESGGGVVAPHLLTTYLKRLGNS